MKKSLALALREPRKNCEEEKKSETRPENCTDSTRRSLGFTVNYGVSPTRIGEIYKKTTGTVLRTQLTQTDKKAIVAALLAGKTTMKALVKQYHVRDETIRKIFKRQTGETLRSFRQRILDGHSESKYRAWHRKGKRLYLVLGVDWFHRQVLIDTTGMPTWFPMGLFILMEKSGLHDRKGKTIYAGDIVQFTIQLSENGITRKTVVNDVVEFVNGSFTLSERSDYDLLAMYDRDCNIIGNIYENPGLLSNARNL